jgi:hypothetical protein
MEVLECHPEEHQLGNCLLSEGAGDVVDPEPVGQGLRQGASLLVSPWDELQWGPMSASIDR